MKTIFLLFIGSLLMLLFGSSIIDKDPFVTNDNVIVNSTKWFVNASADTAIYNNDGTDWPNAFINLQDAINAADVGDEIWVAKGIYHPTEDQLGNPDPNDPSKLTFLISRDLRLYGGFAGFEAQLDDRDIVNNETILSGAIPGVDKVNHVVKLRPDEAGPEKEIILDGFTISDGKDQFLFRGAGVQITTTVLSNYTFQISNCVIKDNQSLDCGGGVYFQPNTPGNQLLLHTCTFVLNEGKRGGAVCALANEGINGNSIEVTGCEFLNNSANYAGGAFSVTGVALLTIANSHFENNTLTANQILNEEMPGGGALSLIDNETCNFTGNIFKENGDVSLFDENILIEGGGAIMSYDSDIYIDSCEFNNNRTSGSGAAVSVYGDEASGTGYNCNIANSEFSQNGNSVLTNSGGAIAINGNCTGEITFNSYTENSAKTGGALFMDIIGIDNTLSFEGCHFESNTSNKGSAIASFSDIIMMACKFSNEIGNVIFSPVTPSLEFYHCRFTNNDGTCIAAIEGSVLTEFCTFLNNDGIISKEFKCNNSLFVDSDIDVSDFNFITNSTFFGTNHPAPLLSLNFPLIMNSIIWSPASDKAIFSNSTGSIRHCIISGGFPNGEHIIDIDPRFVDPDVSDFSLQRCSPAVDAGNNSDIISYSDNMNLVDLDDNERIIGFTVDLGAYENQVFEPFISHYFVKADSTGNDQNRGVSWDCPFATIQQAIDIANEGDSIWVAAGTYFPTRSISVDTNDARTKAIILNKQYLKIYGGFAGNEVPALFDLKDRDFDQNPTVISGFHNGVISYHAVYAENLDRDALLDGFTIMNGFSNGNGSNSQKRGGGFYNINSSLSISNCRFVNNRAKDGGGAFANLGVGSPEIKNCTFHHNTSTVAGGAMYLEGSPEIADCIFEADTCLALGGGAIYTSDNARIRRCTFTDNYSLRGGAILALGRPFIEACRFENNNSELGGAIYNLGANLTVVNSVFLYGNAFKGAAIFHGGNFTNKSTVINCTFSQNAVPGSNGILHATNEEEVSIANCIFWGNNGNSIIDENLTVKVDNCIVDNGCNEAGISACNGSNNLDIDPQFVQPFTGDFTLMGSSPAIDAGTNTPPSLPAGLNIATDAAGISRIINGTVDIGAFEYCDDAGGFDCSLVGVADPLSEIPTIYIYPNPASGTINISLDVGLASGEGMVHVYSSTGMVAMEFKLSKGQSTYAFDSSALAAGIYFISVTNEKIKSIQKVIVE